MNRFALALLVALVFSIPSAEARPRCDGDFQFVRGAWVSTRYCRAEQIASVAREMGIRASAETLLAHPARAEELCRFLKSDIRVQPACEQIYSFFQLNF